MKFALRIEKEIKRSTCLYGFDFDNFDGTDFIEIIDDVLKNNSKWNYNSNVKGKRTENIFLDNVSNHEHKSLLQLYHQVLKLYIFHL